MGIYTGTGDGGRTGLFSGQRVSKSHLRVEAYGELDELNSVLGLLISELPEAAAEPADELQKIQSDLFRAGSWLSTLSAAEAGGALEEMDSERTAELERAIDRMNSELPPLRGFVLPGGHPSAALAHVARTVCRRAERRVVALFDSSRSDTDPEIEKIIMLLNRISDYLFVLARHLNQLKGAPEILWKK